MPKLQTNGAKQKRTTYMILLLWAALCFALLVVDWCCWAPNRLDADMASEQLLANLLAQEGGVMSTNWYYSTELRVLNTQLVMAPLFRLFTSWHTVRVVGSVVLILLYLAAWFWFGHSAKLKYSGLLGGGILALGGAVAQGGQRAHGLRGLLPAAQGNGVQPGMQLRSAGFSKRWG